MEDPQASRGATTGDVPPSAGGEGQRGGGPNRMWPFGWLHAAPDKTIAAALLMAAVAAMGWSFQHIITVQEDKATRAAAWELDHIGKQLELLYGPLYYQIQAGGTAWTQFQQIFKRQFERESPFVITNSRQPGDPEVEVVPLSDAEWAVWIAWTEHEFIPRNRAVTAALRSRADLIEEWAGLSDAYRAFLRHHEAFEANWRTWEQTRNRSLWRPGPNWPWAFDNEIEDTFTCLKVRQVTLGGVLRGGAQAGQTMAECRAKQAGERRRRIG